MIRKLLKNRIILLSVLVLLAVTVLSVWQIERIEKEKQWDAEDLQEFDWLFMPGIYSEIIMEEVNGQVVFLVTDRQGEKQVIDENGKRLHWKGVERMYTTYNSIDFHPAGYGIAAESRGMGEYLYQVVDLDGNTLYDGGNRQPKLTELAGYVLPGDGSVVSLEIGETVYKPKEGEAVGHQQGDYWVITVTFPWQTEFNTKTLCYLRNLDFSVAQDGKLFSYVGYIEGDRVMGTVLEDYDYYDSLPEYDAAHPELAETNVILDGAGNQLLPADGTYTSEDVIFSRYNWFETRVRTEDTFINTIHFLDNLPEDDEALELAPGMVLWSLSEDGLMIFADPGRPGEGEERIPERRGVMNRQGDILLPPVFANVMKAENGYAVVFLGGEYGVIRIGGEPDEG